MALFRTPPRRALAAGALALALGTTALTALPGLAETRAAPPIVAPARLAGPDFADVAARVAPSVVRISVAEAARPAALDAPRRAGQGSGFVIDGAGYIATNAHVVGEAQRVRVGLADGREFEGRVIGLDRATDIALVKVEAGAPLPAVTLSDSDAARVGEWVMAMGNPFGLGGSVTAGIISARGRQIGAGPYDDFIQTDAPINPGNSGGPLFNAAGEAVGMNTAIFSPSGGNVGIGFAVPSNMLRQVTAELREHGRVDRGRLGVALQPVDAEMAAALGLAGPGGALLSTVEPGSAAAAAGLRPGDVVVAVAGREVKAPRDLAAAIGAARPGSTVALDVVRDGARAERSVTLGGAQRREAAAAEPASGATPALGLGLAARREGGVAVASVVPGSIAAERGLQPGDVIRRVGGRVTETPRDVVEAVGAARDAGRGSIALQVEREGASRFVALPLRAA
ncbi:trypsin-like peptidase domain-containing protein [Roseomonas sp. PWR1]|uniref:Probable periplasmic serine endoprotease DegP-like n=1 Tax=Roseomonas nitratireducens TaxID=2820810 RepID=A0ABS4AY61_9PROT|nr:trypsin-like peptidase domain-containing protein [Neoroseomonas nitratireducens]MBP0466313.1 trypsin-like peptidase domain-containing protein [Neoroseomonas nitratireducens]